MLAQSYHWTLEDIKRLSYMQVIMLQAAAGFNRKLLDARLEDARKKGSQSPTEAMVDEQEEMFGGKRFKELTSDELITMASGNGPRPKVIKTKKDTDGQQQEPESE